MKQVLLAASLSLFLAAPAWAADPAKRIGTFGDWDALSFAEGSAKTCYLAAPGKVQGGEKGVKASAFLTVTHRSGGKSIDEVSLSVGGTHGFKKDSKVELRIGPKAHSLFTKGDRAWAEDAKADKAIVETLRKGKDAQMKAEPGKGAEVTAVFPLSGFSDALAAADKACGVKR